MDEIALLKEMVDSAENIVFFGGAGVSTESGIPDFRSADGLYAQNGGLYTPEEIVSGGFFHSHTADFYNFYREKMLYPDALPNAAHKKLAQWEKEGKLLAVITQNIDGLHQKAGSKNVLELHGSAHRNYCMRCGAFYPLEYILSAKNVPTCEKCGGLIKPDVVLYGEGLDNEVLYKVSEAIDKCDLLIVGGTSLAVYPAAAFVLDFNNYASDGKKRNLVVINRSYTGADSKANLVIHRNIGEVFSQI